MKVLVHQCEGGSLGIDILTRLDSDRVEHSFCHPPDSWNLQESGRAQIVYDYVLDEWEGPS